MSLTEKKPTIKTQSDLQFSLSLQGDTKAFSGLSSAVPKCPPLTLLSCSSLCHEEFFWRAFSQKYGEMTLFYNSCGQNIIIRAFLPSIYILVIIFTSFHNVVMSQNILLLLLFYCCHYNERRVRKLLFHTGWNNYVFSRLKVCWFGFF